MRKLLILVLFAACAAPVHQAPMQHEEEESSGVGRALLWYLPNRISDLLDVARARVRLGPGLAFGARATEFADVYLGSYGSVFVGIPGPRGERGFNWPFGLETNTGAELSVLDATASGGVNYGMLEVGLGGQLLIVGVDVGVDVFEVVDLLTGLVGVDLVEDDS